MFIGGILVVPGCTTPRPKYKPKEQEYSVKSGRYIGLVRSSAMQNGNRPVGEKRKQSGDKITVGEEISRNIARMVSRKPGYVHRC
ncbi:hypothetical protein [Enterobacter sp. 22466]|uniref:hypothetical protein n=1 Tax=Enterobacter sp. 22466 TaxID=3453924 RepID=UPI003F83169F